MVPFAGLKAIGGSALTDPAIPLPEGDLGREGVPVSYVPFRNAHLLATAVSWAEVLGAPAIHVGFVEEDSSGYPDCREVFLQAFELAANLGTKPGTRISLKAPLVHLKKAEIVRRGLELGAPLQLTWSCYQGEARGLRPLRFLPAAAAGLPGGRRSRPHPLRPHPRRPDQEPPVPAIRSWNRPSRPCPSAPSPSRPPPWRPSSARAPAGPSRSASRPRSSPACAP